MAILAFPFRLARWVFVVIYKALTNASTSEVKFGANEKKERLADILLRLEEIKHEQEELLEDMKVILNSTDIKQREPNVIPSQSARR